MSNKGRVVYSTDPTPLEKPKAKVETVSPKQQTVYVERDRKGRKGKTVTVVSCLQHNPDMLGTMLKQFKTLCGAGGTVKDGNLEIQGDHRDKLIEKLRDLGYQVKAKGG